MTIGVTWEMLEYANDTFLQNDTQKDKIITNISSVLINEKNENVPIKIKNIEKTLIYGTNSSGEEIVFEIEEGYLDVGINDTMKDLIVNFIGAFVFSIIGMLYIQDRDGYKFAENFIPVLKEKEKEEKDKEKKKMQN